VLDDSPQNVSRLPVNTPAMSSMRRMRAVAASYSGPPILAWPQSVVAAVRQARMVSIMRVLVS
jgi:hypothetical protein